MKGIVRIQLLAALAALATLAFATGVAFAHERRDVGKYQFVVGFAVEPAFEGAPNGASLRVTNRETNTPVTGLEKTLQVEIHHGDAETIKSLRAVFGQPGLYQADFIPTAPGTYEFHFKGTVEGLAVEEEFVSGPGRFNDMQSSTDLQFPVKLPEARELEAAARGALSAAESVGGAATDAKSAADSALTEARDAKSKASTAMTLAFTGIALGLAGATIAVAGLYAARKKAAG